MRNKSFTVKFRHLVYLCNSPKAILKTTFGLLQRWSYSRGNPDLKKKKKKKKKQSLGLTNKVINGEVVLMFLLYLTKEELV